MIILKTKRRQIISLRAGFGTLNIVQTYQNLKPIRVRKK